MQVRDDWDVIVLGSGAGGLTAALAAAARGARTLLVERCARLGGTLALSSGAIWAPGHPWMVDAAADTAQAGHYLDELVGSRGDVRLRQAYLDAFPAVLRWLADEIGIPFLPGTAPDYRQDVAGASATGRALAVAGFDGRRLGIWFDQLRAPMTEMMLPGGAMIDRGEFLGLARRPLSSSSMMLLASRYVRLARDRLRHARGTRLLLGNALAAHLLAAALDRGVQVVTQIETLALLTERKRVTGIAGDGFRWRARLGVVLAGGGFPNGGAWRERFLPTPIASGTPAAPGSTGTTLDLALAAGVALAECRGDGALWFPSSRLPRRDGGAGWYPHIALDRAKPGIIAVDGTGRRFVNEALSYHEFTRAMYARHREAPAIPCWLLADARALARYGLGAVPPRWPLRGGHLRRGYLMRETSLEALARRLGAEAATLRETVARFNAQARRGIDEDFGRGATVFERHAGDPDVVPNPCLGPLDKPPFHAIRLDPTPLATCVGLRTTPHAQACDAHGDPVPGLYVCGADMDAPFGGEYPGPGAQIGPAMFYGFQAGRHATSNAEQA